MQQVLKYQTRRWNLLEAIVHPALGITLDTSHANLANLDIPAAIVMSPRLYATHISDNDGSGDQHLTPGNAIPFYNCVH
ncbi:MAG: sugar phosphate isomerase/epimerase [Anaerolineales bacterium]|nr:MAG: sugar phosphate isomerase/epimerase [Anaerolineales bacterium]